MIQWHPPELVELHRDFAALRSTLKSLTSNTETFAGMASSLEGQASTVYVNTLKAARRLASTLAEQARKTAEQVEAVGRHAEEILEAAKATGSDLLVVDLEENRIQAGGSVIQREDARGTRARSLQAARG